MQPIFIKRNLTEEEILASKELNIELVAKEEDSCKFIDKTFEDVCLKNMKLDLYNDLKEDLKTFVKHELLNKPGEKILLENLQSEIEFLRQEICEKNKIIDKLTEKSLMHIDKDFSYKNTFNKLQDQNFDDRNSPGDECLDSFNDQLSLPSISPNTVDISTP